LGGGFTTYLKSGSENQGNVPHQEAHNQEATSRSSQWLDSSGMSAASMNKSSEQGNV
jgi:hypothetical protein